MQGERAESIANQEMSAARHISWEIMLQMRYLDLPGRNPSHPSVGSPNRNM